jgi:hypothetical protein
MKGKTIAKYLFRDEQNFIIDSIQFLLVYLLIWVILVKSISLNFIFIFLFITLKHFSFESTQILRKVDRILFKITGLQYLK